MRPGLAIEDGHADASGCRSTVDRATAETGRVGSGRSQAKTECVGIKDAVGGPRRLRHRVVWVGSLRGCCRPCSGSLLAWAGIMVACFGFVGSNHLSQPVAIGLDVDGRSERGMARHASRASRSQLSAH